MGAHCYEKPALGKGSSIVSLTFIFANNFFETKCLVSYLFTNQYIATGSIV